MLVLLSYVFSCVGLGVRWCFASFLLCFIFIGSFYLFEVMRVRSL